MPKPLIALASLRKEIVVPILSSAFVAALSLAFYFALAHAAGTELTAQFIATISLAGMVQVALVPAGWIFVFAATDTSMRKRRSFAAHIVEVSGGLCGLLIVVPLGMLTGQTQNLLVAYVALCLAGSNSTLGFLRGENRWLAFAAFVMLPSVLRFASTIALMSADSSLKDDLTNILVLSWLLPEIIRYLLFTLPLAFRNRCYLSLAELKSTASAVFQNWLYDIGSAVTEVADKYLLSFVLSPEILVLYFFVRRLSAASTIVLEPIYAAIYKQFSANPENVTRRGFLAPLLKGYSIAFLISLSVVVLLAIANVLNGGGTPFVPLVIATNFGLFAVCSFLDGAIAANRWGRYVALARNASLTLLINRILSFVVFITSVGVVSRYSEQLALVLGMLCYAVLDLANTVRRASSKVS